MPPLRKEEKKSSTERGISPVRTRTVSPQKKVVSELEAMTPAILSQVMVFISLLDRGELSNVSLLSNAILVLRNTIKNINLDLSSVLLTHTQLVKFLETIPEAKISGLNLILQGEITNFDVLRRIFPGLRKLYIDRDVNYKHKENPLDLLEFCSELRELKVRNFIVSSNAGRLISSLSNLEYLELKSPPFRGNFIAIENLSKLKTLKISNSLSCKTLSLLGCDSLTTLILENMRSLRETNFSNFNNLEKLSILGFSALVNLSFLPQCVNLKHFDRMIVTSSGIIPFFNVNLLSHCLYLKSLNLTFLSTTEDLNFRIFKELENLSFANTTLNEVPLLPSSLEDLKITIRPDRYDENDMLRISDCINLKKLHFTTIEAFDVQFLELFDNLEDLHLQCNEIYNMNELISLPRLTKLYILTDSVNMIIPPMYNSKTIKDLSLIHVSNIVGITDCLSITKIKLASGVLQDIRYLASCSNLEEIKIDSPINRIYDLVILTKLTTLDLQRCYSITNDMIEEFLNETKSLNVIVIAPDGEIRRARFNRN
jgi:hypothetical protein